MECYMYNVFDKSRLKQQTTHVTWMTIQTRRSTNSQLTYVLNPDGTLSSLKEESPGVRLLLRRLVSN